MLRTWLTAWLLGIAGVAGLLAGSWTISTYRGLVRDGAPAAGKVLRKLWLTPVTWVLRRGRLGMEPDWWGEARGSGGISDGGQQGDRRRLFRVGMSATCGFFCSRPSG